MHHANPHHPSSSSTNSHQPSTSYTNPDQHPPSSTAPALGSLGRHGSRGGLNQTAHYPPHYKNLFPHPVGTNPFTWCVGILCALFWVLVIIGGIIVLIVYLVFRPRSPRLEISSFTLNAAYLDMGSLLNADVTILANFTNPNTKVDISFDYMAVDLYYGKTLIAAQGIVPPFVERRGETVIRSIHLVASQVALSMEEVDGLKKQIGSSRISFQVVGSFRTRSNLGKLLHYSYWLYGRCDVVVSGPPSGVILSSRCSTKR